MANGKHTDNGVDQRIVKFIGRHHVMTIASAATECGPYCANLFYAYIPERNLFVFTSDDRTRHYREMYLNGRVAATIVLATQGDPQALEQVIRHYRPYILSLCRREYIAENGNVSIVCDNELKLRLEAKLMAKILLFDIRERTYKT